MGLPALLRVSPFLLLLCLAAMDSQLLLVRAQEEVVVDEASSGEEVALRNGHVSLVFLRPSGRLLSVAYGGQPNLLATWPAGYAPPDPPAAATLEEDRPTYGLPGGAPSDRGYWNAVWENETHVSNYDAFDCDSFSVVSHNSSLAILKFSRQYDPSAEDRTAINSDISIFYSLAAGESGFYTWTVLDHSGAHPAFTLVELRFTLKLSQSFRWAAVDRNRRHLMPEWEDRYAQNSDPTAIAETRLLTNPSNPDLKNMYDCKYSYMEDTARQLYYGWVSNDSSPVGVWALNPHKYEYAAGGPTKQDLTVQVGPYLLNYMHSQHVGTPGLAVSSGEKWRKMYGPFKTYFNQQTESESSSGSPSSDLLDDAIAMAVKEKWQWPYSQFSDPIYYPPSGARGSLKGYLTLDSSAGVDLSSIDLKKNGWVGLTASSAEGSWMYETKTYQYWEHFVNAKSPKFRINNVRPGIYTLHIYILGVYGEYASSSTYNITASTTLDLGEVQWKPPRAGPTIFELGYPDRDSAEFFVPDINPKSILPYSNSNPNRFRDYGVWKAYVTAFPSTDLVYTVGSSDYSTDWWYVQTSRYSEDLLSASPTVYTLVFTLPSAPASDDVFTLRLALASESLAALQVFVNINDFDQDPLMDTSTFATHTDINDNGMARLTSHGTYSQYDIAISGSSLKSGANRMYFRQRRTASRFIYVMYDYIRLEGPSAS